MTGNPPPLKHAIPIVGHDDLVGAWVTSKTGGSWFPGRGRCIGLFDGKGIVAGVIFEGYSGTNVHMHIAARDLNRRWLTRKFLWICLHYPFVQLKCRRVTASVPSTNKDCLRFIRSLGFVQEASLEEAVPEGDLLVHVLWRRSSRVQSILKYGEEHKYLEQTGHPATT